MLYKIDADFLLNILSIKPDVNDFLLTSIADVFARHYALLGMIAKTPKERIYMALENLAVEMGTEDEEKMKSCYQTLSTSQSLPDIAAQRSQTYPIY